MSYSRWKPGVWYTYRNSNNNFEIMHPLYKIVTISYEIAKEMTTAKKLRKLLSLIDKRYKKVSLKRYKELLKYLQEYIQDFENDFLHLKQL